MFSLKSEPRLLPFGVRKFLPSVLVTLTLVMSVRQAWTDTVLTNCSEATLRLAVARGGTITLTCGGTITLDQPITITADTRLGASNTPVIITGSATETGLFQVAAGVELVMTNLHLFNGRNTNGAGGAIVNSGRLIAIDCVFSNNLALGALGMDGAKGNDGAVNGSSGKNAGSGATGYGGAIYNLSEAALTRCVFLTNVVFGGNGGSGGAGGNGNASGGNGGKGGPGGGAWGGAVASTGPLAVTNCFFQFNYTVAGSGGDGGTNGTGAFSGFIGHGGPGGAGSGGAIWLGGNGVLIGSTFADNHAISGDSADAGSNLNFGEDGPAGVDAFGGAVSSQAPGTVVNCTFSGNSAIAGSGGNGAAANTVGGNGGRGGHAWGGSYYNAAQTWMTNCTFLGGSTSPGLGGSGGTAEVVTGEDGHPGESRGGNVANNGPAFVLQNTLLAFALSGSNVSFTTTITYTTNVTLSATNVATNTVKTCYDDNLPSGPCSVITNINGIQTNVTFTCPTNIGNAFCVTNSLVVVTGYTGLTNIVASTNITASTNTTPANNASGAFIDGGYNLSSDNTPALGSTSFLQQTNLRLSPLQMNGGPTPTIALLPGSPAIDRATNGFPATDQRGIPRPVRRAADIGAYEEEGWTIGGQVTENGIGLPGVLLTVNKRTATSDATGHYTIYGLGLGTKWVIPSFSGCVFTPPSNRVDLGSNAIGVNFTAIRILDIRGRITNELGQPVLGIIVTGGGRTNRTDTEGYYTLSNVLAGSVTVTPSSDLYEFTPTSRTFTLKTNSVPKNFLASRRYLISGTIRDRYGSNLLNAVTVRLGDWTAQADTNGMYRFTMLESGQYTVQPESSGYTFDPPIRAYTVGPDVTNAHFDAIGLYSISGQVTTNGLGLAGVTVTASNRSTVTMSGGYYALTNLPARTFLVTPSLSGFSFTQATRQVTVPPNAVNIDFVGTPVIRVAGFVTSATGQAITNVTVAIGIQTGQTGANGRYAIKNVPAGPVTVVPSLTGYAFAPSVYSNSLSTNVTNINFTGFPVFSLRGQVTFNGSGLSNVWVQAGTNSVRTTNDGSYRFTGLRAGNYTVTPQLDGYRFGPASTNVTVTTNDLAKVNFTASGAWSVAGTVTNRTGAPLSGVLMTLGSLSTTTTPNGTYSFTNLAPGSYLVTPFLAQRVFQPGTSNVAVTGAVVRADFGGFAAYNLSGRVINETSDGLARVTVQARGGVVVSGTTDTGGYFTLTGVAEGANQVVPTLSGYIFEPAEMTVVVNGNTNGLVFVGKVGFTVSGLIRDGTNLLTGVKVKLGTREAQTTNGFYKFTDLAAGNYTVQPESAGYTFDPPIRGVTLGPDATNANFQAIGIYSLRGRITTNGNVVLPGVTVTAGNRTAVTDATGAYVLTNLSSGTFTVTPKRDGYFFTPRSTNVFLPPDAVSINFIGAAGVNVSGCVTNSSGEGMTNVLVISGSQQALTDTNGCYQLTEIPAGTIVIDLSLAGYGFDPAPYTNTWTTDQTNVNFRGFPVFTASGRVTLSGTGAANVTVVAGHHATTTTSDGSYTLTNLPAGTHTVTPKSEVLRFDPASQPAVITTNNLTGLDFTAAGNAIITGSVALINGLLLEGVTVTLIELSLADETTADGNYAFNDLAPGTYTVVPYLAQHIFLPSSVQIAITNASPTSRFQANFIGARVFNVSGRIMEAVTNPLAGATVRAVGLTNVSTLTTSGGYYTLVGVAEGTNTITASKTGYDLDPASATFPRQTNAYLLTVSADTFGADFAAFPLFNIRGNVAYGTEVLSNVLVTVTGGSAGAKTTNSTMNGSYLVSGLRAGAYSVTPSLQGYQFTPVHTNVSLGPDANNVNFTAAGILSISGQVTEGSSGVAGIRITGRYTNASGITVTTNTTTAVNGGYLLNNLRPRTYTLSPLQMGIGFSPTNLTINLLSNAAVDFAANRALLEGTRSNQAIKLLGLGLPSRSYLLQTSTNIGGGSVWNTAPDPIVADTNGFFEFLEPLDTNRPAKYFRTFVP